VLSDRLGALPSGLRFDLLVGNPPYIPAAEIPLLDPEVRQFDPLLALDGGVDGLSHYHYLAEQASHWLTDAGKMMLEFGDAQENLVREALERQNWIVEAIIDDYTPRPRIIVAAPAAASMRKLA